MAFRKMTLAAAAAAAVATLQPAFASGGKAPDGFKLSADGTTLAHELSGFTFPKQVGHFTRSGETSFDPSGQYIAVHYEYAPRAGEPVLLRISLVNIEGMTAAEHYAAMKPQAQRYFSAVSVLSEGPTRSSQDAVPAYRGTFSGSRTGTPWEFSLTTLDFGNWGARVVTAYPKAVASKARPALDGFIAAFPGKPAKPQQGR